MKLPAFNRQSDTTNNADEPTVVPPNSSNTTTAPASVRNDGAVVPPKDRADETTASLQPVAAERSATTATTDRVKAEHAEESAKSERIAAEHAADRAEAARKADLDATVPPAPVVDHEPKAAPVIAGPKPRASLLATLGLITGVASALLVLSGPLAGYGIGLAGLALILSLGGISATGRRHVAGKSDAIIGMVLALAAIVVGVLALTGSLSWLGTDMQPVNSLREWLDAQFANIF